MSSEGPGRSSGSRRGAATREEILDAAWELVAEHGAEVSMARIAAHVGISRQAVYQHFGTRGGLLVALVRRADTRLHIREDFQRAGAIADPVARLDATLQAWFRFVPKIHPVARDLVRLRATDPDADLAWSERMSELRAGYRELTEGLRRDAALAPDWTAAAAADYLWAASSVQAWALLVIECGWSPARASRVLRATIAAAVLR